MLDVLLEEGFVLSHFSITFVLTTPTRFRWMSEAPIRFVSNCLRFFCNLCRSVGKSEYRLILLSEIYILRTTAVVRDRDRNGFVDELVQKGEHCNRSTLDDNGILCDHS
ncbi:unnamed protein product [Amoebophrya sp. A120]|nr:unnamed protein product [Amoebophrya sp. A120]|eukprot:GSA120T00017936001.1